MATVTELSTELDALESLLAAKRQERIDASLVDLLAQVDERASMLAQARADAEKARADADQAEIEKDEFAERNREKHAAYIAACMRATAAQTAIGEADRLWREARQQVQDVRERLQKLDP